MSPSPRCGTRRPSRRCRRPDWARASRWIWGENATCRRSGCPAGRFADPKECGDLVAFLCGTQSGFMTAQNIVNDGGFYQGLF